MEMRGELHPQQFHLTKYKHRYQRTGGYVGPELELMFKKQKTVVALRRLEAQTVHCTDNIPTKVHQQS